MTIVGVVATIDLLLDGEISPQIQVLFVSVFAPLVPALVLRTTRKNGNR